MPMAVEGLTRSSSKSTIHEAIALTIALLLREYRRSGKIGNSRPRSLSEATKQATAIAYQVARKKTGRKDL